MVHEVLVPRRYEHLMLERTLDRVIIDGHSIVTYSDNMPLRRVVARRFEYLTVVRRVCRWNHVLEDITHSSSMLKKRKRTDIIQLKIEVVVFSEFA